MEQVQTIVCPNCGAVTASNQNCEYCGSLLTRIASVLYDSKCDSTKDINDFGFGKTAYTSIKLCKVIEKSIVQCNKHNSEVECIFELDGTLDAGLTVKLISAPDKPSKLVFKFDMKNKFAHYKFRDFENSSIGKLFDTQQIEEKMLCSIQLDNEARTSAQLIDYILRERVPKYDNDTQISPRMYVTLNGNRYKIVATKYDDEIVHIQTQYDKFFESSYNKYLSTLPNPFQQVTPRLWCALAICVIGWVIPFAFFDSDSDSFMVCLILFGVISMIIIIYDGVLYFKESKVEYYKDNYWSIDFEQAKQDKENAYWIKYFNDAHSSMNYIVESD